ncbi:hypothetical protein MTY414_56140 [Mycolicibacterium mageritense]|nr:hypothetical protein MTY414_56140 [Mycolicibacterium mageritense]
MARLVDTQAGVTGQKLGDWLAEEFGDGNDGGVDFDAGKAQQQIAFERGRQAIPAGIAWMAWIGYGGSASACAGVVEVGVHGAAVCSSGGGGGG